MKIKFAWLPTKVKEIAPWYPYRYIWLESYKQYGPLKFSKRCIVYQPRGVK